MKGTESRADLKCAICGWRWMRRGKDPERCPNDRCRSLRWREGKKGLPLSESESMGAGLPENPLANPVFEKLQWDEPIYGRCDCDHRMRQAQVIPMRVEFRCPRHGAVVVDTRKIAGGGKA